MWKPQLYLKGMHRDRCGHVARREARNRDRGALGIGFAVAALSRELGAEVLIASSNAVGGGGQRAHGL